jgi:hypothetical protein
VGLAVGDVIGHDLEAASAMAQIRAALRAYAVHGDPPSTVITALGHLVDTFNLTQLVTVTHGVLEPAGADGTRSLGYTNAGHLPPFLRHPDGRVESLSAGGSVVIGAQMSPDHTQAERLIAPDVALLAIRLTPTHADIPKPSRPTVVRSPRWLSRLAGTVTPCPRLPMTRCPPASSACAGEESSS